MKDLGSQSVVKNEALRLIRTHYLVLPESNASERLLTVIIAAIFSQLSIQCLTTETHPILNTLPALLSSFPTPDPQAPLLSRSSFFDLGFGTQAFCPLGYIAHVTTEICTRIITTTEQQTLLVKLRTEQEMAKELRRNGLITQAALWACASLGGSVRRMIATIILTYSAQQAWQVTNAASPSFSIYSHRVKPNKSVYTLDAMYAMMLLVGKISRRRNERAMLRTTSYQENMECYACTDLRLYATFH